MTCGFTAGYQPPLLRSESRWGSSIKVHSRVGSESPSMLFILQAMEIEGFLRRAVDVNPLIMWPAMNQGTNVSRLPLFSPREV